MPARSVGQDMTAMAKKHRVETATSQMYNTKNTKFAMMRSTLTATACNRVENKDLHI